MVRAVVAVAIVGALLAGCAQPTEFADRATLLKEAAADIRLPGSVELAHVGSDRVTTFEGPQPAFDGYILGTTADAEAVRSYYARELQRLGWRLEASTSHSTAELAAWWWCKPRINYRLAIKDQRKAFKPEFYRGQTFTTVFDATLNSREPGIACPYVPSADPTQR